jgi:hypothetical protein
VAAATAMTTMVAVLAATVGARPDRSLSLQMWAPRGRLAIGRGGVGATRCGAEGDAAERRECAHK